MKCFYTPIIGRCAELDCGPFDLGAVPLPWLRFKTSGLLGRKITGGDKTERERERERENRWRYVISPASGKLKVGLISRKLQKGGGKETHATVTEGERGGTTTTMGIMRWGTSWARVRVMRGGHRRRRNVLSSDSVIGEPTFAACPAFGAVGKSTRCWLKVEPHSIGA